MNPTTTPAPTNPASSWRPRPELRAPRAAGPIDCVLFLGFGGPLEPSQIMPYLRNVTQGRGIPEARLHKVEHHYLDVGGRSPYNDLTERQARGVERWLAEHGHPLPVYVAMRNWDPYFADVLRRMNDDGRRHAAGVILSAHRSEVSWERYMGDYACATVAVGGRAPEITYLPAGFAHPRFLEANVQLIEETSGYLRGSLPESVPLLLTAHSIPTRMADASPYVSDLVASCDGVARRLGVRDWELCYQSRSGDPRTPWLEPDVNDVLRRRAAAGMREVVVQAVGFLSDHVEVLFDLDIEARGTCEEIGVRMHRAGCVNDHPEFVAMLGELVLEEVTHFIGA
jgi:ferrochelatase